MINLDAAQFSQKITDQKVVILDVRTAAEFAGAGWLNIVGRGALWGCGGVHGRADGQEVLFLPDVPVQCPPVLFG